jgi:hypothetical protein
LDIPGSQHSNPGSTGKEGGSTTGNYPSYYVPQMSPEHDSYHNESINPDQSVRTEFTSVESSPTPKTTPEDLNIPPQYRQYSRVFSEEASHEFPPSHIWDHVIKLKPNAPAALPGKLIPLSQAEQEELRNFVAEHTKRGMIRPSKSPYKARFFYIKKKDGKLHPIQDYRPVNQWTIHNTYPLPLIPELID